MGPTPLEVDALGASNARQRLRAYDRLNAIASILTISLVIGFTYFLPTRLFDQIAIYGAAILMAVVSLIWHSTLTRRFDGPTKTFAKYLVDTVFVTLFIQYTGEVASPFFFLYYVILLAVALGIGVRHTFLLAGVMTIAYIVMSGVAINRLIMDPLSFIYLWANVVALWFVAYLAACLAEEAERARSAVEEAKAKVETFSKVDWLTGLFNMKHFDALTAQELGRSDRYGRPCTLLMVDSDHLKDVNDTFGHAAGDRYIAALADVLTRTARLSDSVIRYGGDEFLVLLPETDSRGAASFGERLRAAVEAVGLAFNGQPIATSVSIGMATYPRDATDAMGLLARADAALYHAKQSGRNRVAVYTADMEHRAEIDAAPPPAGRRPGAETGPASRVTPPPGRPAPDPGT